MTTDVLSNVDTVAKALDKIEARLKSVDALMGSIGKSSSAGAKNIAGAAQGAFSGTPIGGSGKANGTASALFPTGARFGGAAAPAGPPTAASAAESPTFLQSFANRRPVAFGAGMAVLGAGAAAWGALPGIDEVRGQRQAMFTATLGYGASTPDFAKLKSNMMGAFGGYATSSSSQENVARTMSLYGMSMRPGANTSMSNITGAMSEISAMSLMTGQSNEAMEAARRSLATGSRANGLYMLGISTTNADGSPKDFGATVKQVMDKTMRGKYSLSDVESGLSAGGILRSNLTRLLGAENADLAAQYATTIASTGSADGALSPAQLEKAGLTDAKRSPFAAEAKMTGTRSQTISDYSDPMLAGWGKALEAAQSVERVMQGLSGILSPLAAGKGFGQGLMGQTATAALLGGAGMAGGAIAANGGIAALRGGGAGLAGGAAGAAGGAGGGLLSRAASAVTKGGLLKGGVAGLAGGVGTDLLFGQIGSDADSSEGHKALTTIGKILASTVTSAGVGALVGGGVPGAVVGGLIGLGTGLWGAFGPGGQGMEYGSKANTASASLFGHSGSGEGDDGGGGAGQQKPAEKKEKGRGTGTVAGALQYARNAVKGRQANWKNLCQRFAANCYGLERGHYSSASQAWRSIPKQYKSPGERNAPAGALYYWTGGSSGYGHVAVSMGDGTMACNAADGRIHIQSNAWMFNYYKRLNFEGWAQPYFGRLVTSVGSSSGATAAPTGAVDVDGGGQPTGGRASDTMSGAKGMSATSVRPWGSDMISASPYGGLAAGQYSISSNVASTIEGLMSGGGSLILSGGSQTSDHRSRSVGTAAETGDYGEQGLEGRSGGFVVTSAPGKGKGVERWGNVVRNAMAAAGLPDKYYNLLMARMQTESSGNPNAVNNWDKNAKDGTPSKGLMQVIAPTFERFAGPYKDRGQMDPFANIYAAIKWSQFKYGEEGLQKAWSGKQGYSEGSWRISKDQINKIHEGEMVIPAATAEIVRTNVRKAQAGQGTGGGGARKVELTIHNTGHVYRDASVIAREVARILQEEDQMASIGGF